MLDNFNQPKGSTIGVLKDGRTVQEVIDELGTKYSYIVPATYGAVGDGVTDDSAALVRADAAAAALGTIIDGCGKVYAVGSKFEFKSGGIIRATLKPTSSYTGGSPTWAAPVSGRVALSEVDVLGFKGPGPQITRGLATVVPRVSLSNCRFNGNGSKVRTVTTQVVNTASDLTIAVEDSSVFKVNDYVWIGDSKLIVSAVGSGTLTFVADADGKPATQTGGKGTGSYKAGQYVTKDGNGRNGLTVGDGGPTFNLSVRDCEFNDNGWFGLFNWANQTPEDSTSVTVSGSIANDNGFIGLGLGRLFAGSISDNVVERNGNNGIDINKAHGNVAIRGNAARYNGVDGIFTGSYSTSPNTEGNVCESNFRIGILYSGDASGAAGAVISNNTCLDNPLYNICVTGVAIPTVTDNTLGGVSGVHLKIEGRDGNPNPNPTVSDNFFVTSGSQWDIDVNIGGYTNGGSNGKIVLSGNSHSSTIPLIRCSGFDRNNSRAVPPFYVKQDINPASDSVAVAVEARNAYNTSTVDVMATGVSLQFVTNSAGLAAAPVSAATRTSGVELYNGLANGRFIAQFAYGKLSYSFKAATGVLYLATSTEHTRAIVPIQFP